MAEFNYECPSCEGKFNEWETGLGGTKSCPFCGTDKGSYGGDHRVQ